MIVTIRFAGTSMLAVAARGCDAGTGTAPSAPSRDPILA